MTTVTAAAGRVAELRKKNNELYRRKGEIELALQREHVTQEGAVEKRSALVQELPGADSATTAWLHSEIDVLDKKLRVSSRVAEGLSNSLSRIDGEIAALSVELTEATRIIEHQEREEGLRTLRDQLTTTVQRAERALNDARTALTDLNVLASKGAEQFGFSGQSLIEPIINEFRHRQVNPEAFGWKDCRPNPGGFRFSVTAMVKA